MTIRGVLQVLLVTGSVIAAMASATAPKPPGAYKFDRSRTVRAPVDESWTALIDTFAEHDWAIDKLDKASGLVTTDWMALTSGQAEEFADCGSAPLATSRSQVRFNVTVREVPAGSAVVVNTSFRQLRAAGGASGTVDCTSKGVVEQLVHESVARRVKTTTATKADAGARKTVTGEEQLYCAITAPDVGLCWLDAGQCKTVEGASCEVRSSGSCFTATKVLEQTKKTTCAVSIKDCEARREAVASDPDYTVTPCGDVGQLLRRRLVGPAEVSAAVNPHFRNPICSRSASQRWRCLAAITSQSSDRRPERRRDERTPTARRKRREQPRRVAITGSPPPAARGSRRCARAA